MTNKPIREKENTIVFLNDCINEKENISKIIFKSIGFPVNSL